MIMRIIIDYDSTWQNSFLTGSNDEPVHTRKFKASSKSNEPPDVKEITKNTILGVLSRLIGDQRKLYQAKASDDFYFNDMNITFYDLKQKKEKWNETAFLINKSEKRPPQGSFMGILDDDEPLFFSEYAATLWSILDYELDDLLDFILKPHFTKLNNTVSPKHILNRVVYDISSMDSIQFSETKTATLEEKLKIERSKEKPSEKRIKDIINEISVLNIQAQDENLVNLENKLKLAIKKLNDLFPDEAYITNNGSVYPMSLYAASLYVMVKQFETENIDTSPFLSNRGAIKGFSKRGFNGVRDFLNSLMGNNRKTTHTPYKLTKANGQLEIVLDVDIAKARELKMMIDNAGVSSFYLGKKGLAYVSDIRLR